MYLHASIRQNVCCLLADLFVALEVRPFRAAVVQQPGLARRQVIEVPDPGEELTSWLEAAMKIQLVNICNSGYMVITYNFRSELRISVL